VALAVCAAIAGGSEPARAEERRQSIAQVEQQRRFDIPAQQLSDALAQFGQQAGIQVSVHGDLVSGHATQGVSGTMTPRAALSSLLDGTGLVFNIGESGAVIVDASAAGPDATLLDPILVEGAGGGKAAAADAAGSLTVGYEDMRRRNPQDVRDVFAGESSVSVGGNVPLSQKVYVNGVEETNLAVSIDGARQNNKIFHHNGTNLIDPSLLKAVRVDPGVAPADAGPAALGGSIAYETVDVDDVLAPDRSLGGFATASFDTNGTTVTNGNAAYGRLEGFEGLGYFKWGEGDDYEDGNGEDVAGSGTDLRTFLLKGAYESDTGHRFELSGERVRDRADRPYRANMRDLVGRPDPDTRLYGLTRLNVTASYSTPDATGLWDPNVVIGYSDSDLEVPEPYGSEAGTGSVSAKFENDFNLGPRDIVTAGLDYYDDTAEYDDDFDTMEEKARNVGLYAQARLNPFDPFNVSFGGRADRQWFEGTDGTEIDSFGVSGNVSGTYDVTDFLRLRAGYSNVWGGVALAENFIMNPTWDYSDDIDPVRAQNVTAGFDVEYEGFTFGAGIFRGYFTDVRAATYGGGPGLTTDFDTEGYELSAGYTWGPGFVRATFTDSEITVGGAPASSYDTQYLGAPLGRILAFEAAHRFDSIGLAFGGDLEMAFENTSTADAGGEPLQAYEVVNLYAEYQPEPLPFLSLRAEVNNLFDEAYADRASYGQDFTTVQPLLEPGRSFLFTLRAQF
jgi:hemoglobin/transferrin/lactoferrin receptor protein